MGKEILIVVQDQGFVANLLSRRLSQRGYDVVVHQRDGAMHHLRKQRSSLLLIEAPLARAELMDLCLSLRDQTQAPFILLSDSPLQVEDLEAVDCLTKPVDFRRLFNAVENALTSARKRKPRQARYLRAGKFNLDLQKQALIHGDGQCELTPKEFLLLKMFLNHAGQVLTHKAIMKEVWGTDFTEDKRTLQVHVSWIRKKIEEDSAHPKYLRTVRGVGYRFDAKV